MAAPIRIAKAAARTFLPWESRRRVYRWLAQRYVDALKPRFDRTRSTILLINHHYGQDIRALQLANRDYNLLVVHADQLFRGAKIFFAEEVRRLTAPYPGDGDEMAVKYREECRWMFQRLRARYGVNVIVTASDVFYWVREFIRAAAAQGVRTVVLDKEGLRSPYGFREEALRVQRLAPFMSDHIFVWSERQRQFWMRTGVEEGRITVIGQPRSDLLFAENPRSVDALFGEARPLVTLFSYMDDAYIPPGPDAGGKRSWRRMKKETHDEFARLAKEYPQYNFVIKTHPQQPDLEQLRGQYQSRNLRVIGGSDVANELLQRSELVAAFQSTAVLEGLFLGKDLVYTFWDPLLSDLRAELLPWHEAPGLVVARSLAEFAEVCRRRLSGDRSRFELTAESRAARDAFVDRFLHRPDGHVCERFFKEIGRFLA